MSTGAAIPTLSVVVCTRNRSPSLRRTLDRLLQVTGDGFEILVVDNDSDDDTAEVVRRAGAVAPSVRYLHESTPGLSHARNAGIRAARGDLIAFIDDDALPGPGWVEALVGAFADPAVTGAGGPITLRWEAERPAWYSDALQARYSGLDLGPPARPVRFPDHPYGTNMAFRRAEIQRLGGFRPDLGRQGERLLSFEEGDLFWRLGEAGGVVRWEPAASVEHVVPPERGRVSFVLRRAAHDGLSLVAFERLRGRSRWWFGARLGLVPARFVTRLVAVLGRSPGIRHPRQAAVAVAADAAYYGACELACARALASARRAITSDPP